MKIKKIKIEYDKNAKKQLEGEEEQELELEKQKKLEEQPLELEKQKKLEEQQLELEKQKKLEEQKKLELDKQKKLDEELKVSKEIVYIRGTGVRMNPFFYGLKKIYNIKEVRNDELFLKETKNKVFLWSALRRINSPEYKIWHYRKQNLLPIFSSERGALPNSLILDNNNWLINSLYYDEILWNKELNKSQKKYIDDYFKLFINNSETLEYQGNKNLFNYTKFSKFKKKISIFLQLDNDQVIINGIDWLGSNIKFKKYIIELSKKHSDILFMVKNHPLSKGTITKTTYFDYESDNLILVDDVNYKEVIKESEKVLVVNSSVGLQSMIFGKESGILGKSFFNIKNVNTKLNNKEEVDNFLRREPLKVDIELAKKFIYYLTKEFYINCTMEKKNKIENTADKVTINDNNTYFDKFETIVIFGENNIYNYNFRWGSIERIKELISILSLKYNVKYIYKEKKNNNFSYYAEIINNLNPKVLIVEYLKMEPILEFLNKEITTFIDTHDILFMRTKSFEDNNIKIAKSLKIESNDEINKLNKFDYIITIQNEEEKMLGKYLDNSKILTINYINIKNKYKYFINKDLKNIFFYGSPAAHNVESIKQFILDCWIKFKLFDNFKLNIYGGVCNTHIKKLFNEKYNIKFFGEISNLLNIYKENDLLINPAIMGSGLKIKNVECLSLGCPLITSSVGIQGLNNFNKENTVFVTDNYDEYPNILKNLNYDSRVKISNNIIDEYKSSFSLINNYKKIFLLIDKEISR